MHNWTEITNPVFRGTRSPSQKSTALVASFRRFFNCNTTLTCSMSWSDTAVNVELISFLSEQSTITLWNDHVGMVTWSLNCHAYIVSCLHCWPCRLVSVCSVSMVMGSQLLRKHHFGTSRRQCSNILKLLKDKFLPCSKQKETILPI